MRPGGTNITWTSRCWWWKSSPRPRRRGTDWTNAWCINRPTLQEYVLLAQDKRVAQLYRRTAEGWDLETYGPNEDVRLTAIELTCSIEAIYEAAWD